MGSNVGVFLLATLDYKGKSRRTTQVEPEFLSGLPLAISASRCRLPARITTVGQRPTHQENAGLIGRFCVSGFAAASVGDWLY